MEIEKIICAAVYIDDGGKPHIHSPINIYSGFVILGLRHCNCFATIHALLERHNFDKYDKKQGFITSLNRFVGREEGAEIAREAHQINKKCKILFSEDLY